MASGMIVTASMLALVPIHQTVAQEGPTSAIYVLDEGSFSVWLQDEALQHPNGLKVGDGRLIVAAWGQDLQDDFSTSVAGHLI
jgi:hypothetical protein